MPCEISAIGQIVKLPTIIAFICLNLLNKWPLIFSLKRQRGVEILWLFYRERKTGLFGGWGWEMVLLSSLGGMVNRERSGSWEGQGEESKGF